MIFDSLKNLEQYQKVHPNIYRGLQVLRDTDFSQLEEGVHYKVDGDEVFFFLQNYDSKVVNDTPEAHRKYADIQFMLSGAEKIGVGALQDMTEEVEARPEGDIWFYHGPVEEFTLSGDKFAVFFPGDAHAPSIAVDGKPASCRKCVVKARLD